MGLRVDKIILLHMGVRGDKVNTAATYGCWR